MSNRSMSIYRVISETMTKIQEGEALKGVHYHAALLALSNLALTENKERGLRLDHERAYTDMQNFGFELDVLMRAEDDFMGGE